MAAGFLLGLALGTVGGAVAALALAEDLKRLAFRPRAQNLHPYLEDE